MKTLGTLEETLTTIALCFLTVLLILMPLDISGFFMDTQTYAMVYHLDMGKENWEWSYLSTWAYPLLLIIIGFTSTILRFTRQDNKTIKRINQAFLFLFFSSAIIGFYNWMQSGFDH